MRRIYVDLDDVLAQTGRMLLRVVEEHFGRSIAFESLSSFHLGDSLSLDEEQLEEFLRLAHEPEPLASVDPMPGAAEALAAWRRAGYEVYVVTGRPPPTREATVGWLERHGFAFTEFCLLDKYSQFYDGAHGQAEGALGLGDLPGLDFCLAVEDFPGIIEHLAVDLGIPVALFDRPWNQDLAVPAGEAASSVVRCSGWTEIRRSFPDP